MFCGYGQARGVTETKRVCCAGNGVFRKLFEEKAYLEMLLRHLPNRKHKHGGGGGITLWRATHDREALFEVD